MTSDQSGSKTQHYMQPGELLARSARRWSDTAQNPARLLLRVAILRDLGRDLHARKSQSLAESNTSQLQLLETWAERIRILRDRAELDEDLPVLLAEDDLKPHAKKDRQLPSELYSALPKDKIERRDRAWEAAIAFEACSLGWRFWELDAWIELTSIELWHGTLQNQLWPNGILLYVDIGQPPAPPHAPAWHGRWIVVLAPEIQDPQALSNQLGIESWPGSLKNPSPDQALRWKLLFSPGPA